MEQDPVPPSLRQISFEVLESLRQQWDDQDQVSQRPSFTGGLLGRCASMWSCP
jgi:hypothetical protein